MQYGNKFVHPHKSFIGRFLNFVLNNVSFIKTKRLICHPFTKARLKSDVRNVVFLNWLVPIENVRHLIPRHVKVKQYGKNVLLTVLTYKHGNFRPTMFNWLKPVFGSPLQSNWRLYIDNNDLFQVQEPTVFFLKNVMDSFTYVVGSRVCSNILQSHLPEKFKHDIGETHISTEINPGESNAPDLRVTLKRRAEWKLSSDFESTFSSVENLIDTICYQHFAISDQPDGNQYSVGKINLSFSHADIEPLEVVNFGSYWLENIVGKSECCAFIIKDLSFLSLGEKIVSIKDHEHN